MLSNEYNKCILCARKCGVDRRNAVGYCGMTNEIYIARAALHKWEEPPISGDRGSGTIFFVGCSLGCVFCQNREISRGRAGKLVSVSRLAEIMLDLEKRGAHNINFVTPTHYIPSVVKAVELSRNKGLSIPIVYNTASYETVDSLRLLEGKVDIYLPDHKYFSAKTAAEYSSAPDYPSVATAAISEMFRQVGEPRFDENGIMKKGVIVRVLLLPGKVAEAKLIVGSLYEKYANGTYFSLMSQYTPMWGMTGNLARRVTSREYSELVSYAEKKGIVNCFIQEGGSAEESFIPPFDPLHNSDL